MTNRSGTGYIMAFPLLGLVIASLVCRTCKLMTKSNMVQEYHNGITESKANGNGKVHFLALIFVFACTVGSILNKVSHSHF